MCPEVIFKGIVSKLGRSTKNIVFIETESVLQLEYTTQDVNCFLQYVMKSDP